MPASSDLERHRAAAFSTWVSVVVNTLLCLLQIAIGFFARSQALIADGLHSLSDLIGDFVVLFANHGSSKPADAEHPYGHLRYETVATLMLGFLLIAAGTAMCIGVFNSLRSGLSTPPIHPIALAIGVITLIAKEGLFRYLLAVGKRVKSSMLVANAWHARSDAASSLVVTAGILGNLLGLTFLDPLAAAVVGLMIVRMGWRFSHEALSTLVDRSADEAELKEISSTIRSIPGVRDLHDLKTRKLGDMLAVDVHLDIDAKLNVETAHRITVAVHDALLERHRVIHVMTHIDPWYGPHHEKPSP